MSRFSLTIREYDSITADTKNLRGKALTEKRFNELRKYLLEYNDNEKNSRDIFHIGYKKLTAKGLVGTIETPSGTSVEILPKIPLDKADKNIPEEKQNENTRTIFLHMLCAYLKREKFVQIDNVHINTHKNLPLMEFLIAVFLDVARQLVQRGLARAYMAQEDNLYRLKGKLDIMKQLRYNTVHRERFYVKYDEFSEDIAVNRVIKAALEAAQRLTKNTENRRRVMQLLPHFDMVTPPQNWRTENDRIYMQRNVKDYYENPLNLARLILERLHPAGWRDKQKLYSLLFEMHDLFECYVAEKLRSFNGYHLKAQETRVILMAEESPGQIKFHIQPDMVMRPAIGRTDQPILILDTKWKEIGRKEEKYKISQADLYQLYSYGKRYARSELPPDSPERKVSLVLLYPENENFKTPIVLQEPDNGLKLHIIPVDLSSALDKSSDNTLPYTRKYLNEIIGKQTQSAPKCA